MRSLFFDTYHHFISHIACILQFFEHYECVYVCILLVCYYSCFSLSSYITIIIFIFIIIFLKNYIHPGRAQAYSRPKKNSKIIIN